jgi:hypothetical protein
VSTATKSALAGIQVDGNGCFLARWLEQLHFLVHAAAKGKKWALLVAGRGARDLQVLVFLVCRIAVE